MKAYERIILWLDYFNSSLSRSEGRRVPIHIAMKEPKLEELVEAAKRLGLKPMATEARHPKRPFVNSGYISVEKGEPKERVLKRIAKELSYVRASRK